MQYFASIENHNYHLWQTELLLQSNKNVLIGIAENDSEKVIAGHNLKKANKFTHKNIGREKGYLPLNRPYSVLSALENGILKLPFALIHSDMLFVSDTKPSSGVIFQIEDKFSKEFIQNHTNLKQDWLPLGGIMVFGNKVPINFFRRVVEWLEVIKNDWFYTEKLAWILALLEFNGVFEIEGKYSLECHLLEERECNFVHYSHGISPYFNKQMFRYEPPLFLGMGRLLDSILQVNINKTTKHMCNIINSYGR